MSQNPELDRLRAEADRAFRDQRVAYDRMKQLGNRRHDRKERADASWARVSAAKDEMSAAHQRNQRAWESYRRECDRLSEQIDDVSRDADEEHRMMVYSFEAASDAYQSDDHSSASMHSADGHDHKDRLQSFNAEKHRLIEIAKAMSPPENDFHYYKDSHDRLMADYQRIQDDFQQARADHEAARTEFNRAKERHESAQAALQQAITAEHAKWHDQPCADCGTNIRIHTDWIHPPKYCKSCKEKFARKMEERNKNANRIHGDWAKIRETVLNDYHTSPRTYQTGTKKSGEYVTVKSSWNQEFGEVCSDIIVRSKSHPDEHYHLVVGENGKVFIDKWRKDH